MNLDVGQLFIIGIKGLHLSDEEKQFIVEHNIGGVILFSRNIDNPEQVFELCQSIQALSLRQRDKVPLFIGIDVEGGRVNRLNKSGFTPWPAIKKLGELDSPNVSFQLAAYLGCELKALGINLDFAPCADVLSQELNEVIGDRSIGSDAEKVGRHVSAMVRGFIKSEIIPCVKHFPGHGNTQIDSHLELPIEETKLETLQIRELIPFQKAIRSKVPMVMTSHILFKNIDPQFPVTFSKRILHDILRQQLRYQNLIISDDLDMKALRLHYDVKDIPLKAIEAGVQLLLYCNEPESVKMGFESIQDALNKKDSNFSEVHFSGIRRIGSQILNYKKHYLKPFNKISFQEVQSRIASPEYMNLVQQILTKNVKNDDFKN